MRFNPDPPLLALYRLPDQAPGGREGVSLQLCNALLPRRDFVITVGMLTPSAKLSHPSHQYSSYDVLYHIDAPST